MAFDFSKSVPVFRQIEVLDQVIEECMTKIFKIALLIGENPDTLTYDWEPEGGVREGDTAVMELMRELKKMQFLDEKRAALGGE